MCARGAAGERDPTPDASRAAGHDHRAVVEVDRVHGAITEPPSTTSVAPVTPRRFGSVNEVTAAATSATVAPTPSAGGGRYDVAPAREGTSRSSGTSSAFDRDPGRTPLPRRRLGHRSYPLDRGDERHQLRCARDARGGARSRRPDPRRPRASRWASCSPASASREHLLGASVPVVGVERRRGAPLVAAPSSPHTYTMQSGCGRRLRERVAQRARERWRAGRDDAGAGVVIGA